MVLVYSISCNCDLYVPNVGSRLSASVLKYHVLMLSMCHHLQPSCHVFSVSHLTHPLMKLTCKACCYFCYLIMYDIWLHISFLDSEHDQHLGYL